MKKIKLIPLSKNGRVNKGKYFAVVDDKDYNWLNRHNWYAFVYKKGKHGNSHTKVYAFRHNPEGNPNNISMHRQIKGFPKDRRIYFKNQDTLDCRRKNLSLNKPHTMYDFGKRRTDGKSKFRGVSWQENMGKWRVTFRNKELGILKQLTIGFAGTQKEGAQMYNDFVKEKMKKHNKKLFLNKITY